MFLENLGLLRKEPFLGYSYRAGLSEVTIDGKQTFYHSGSTIGANSFFLTIPEQKLNVILLTNHSEKPGVSLLPSIAQYFGVGEILT